MEIALDIAMEIEIEIVMEIALEIAMDTVKEVELEMAMEIVKKLSMEESDRVLYYLPLQYLCSFGAWNKHWRERTNQNYIWIRLCRLRGWSKFGDDKNPAYILEDSSSTSPMFSHPSANNCIRPQNPSLSKLCKWKEVFMKVNHLNGNWKNGRHVDQTRNDVSAFDCNGHILLAGTYDGCLLLCSLLTRTIIHRLELEVDVFVMKIKIYEGNAAIGCSDGTVRVFKIEAELLVETLRFRGSKSVDHLEFQGILIVSACGEGDVTVWSLSQSTHLYHLVGHTTIVTCLSMSGDCVVTGSCDGTLIIWNAALGVLMQHLRGHTSMISSCQFNQEKVYSSSHDRTVCVWRIATGECLMELNYHDHVNSFECVTFNDRYIAAGTSGLNGGAIYVWNLNGEELQILREHHDIVQHLQMKDGRLVSVGDNCETIIWDLESGEQLNVVQRLINEYFNLMPYSSMWMNETKLITLSDDHPFKLTVIDYWRAEKN